MDELTYDPADFEDFYARHFVPKTDRWTPDKLAWKILRDMGFSDPSPGKMGPVRNYIYAQISNARRDMNLDNIDVDRGQLKPPIGDKAEKFLGILTQQGVNVGRLIEEVNIRLAMLGVIPPQREQGTRDLPG